MKFFTCVVIVILLFIPLSTAQNETPQWYRNRVYGTVNYSDGSVVQSGSVLFLVRTTNSTTECAISNGIFSCYISAPYATQFVIYYMSPENQRYYLNQHIIAVDNAEIDFSGFLNLAFSPSTNNFADADRDGVPDDRDLCSTGIQSVQSVQEEVDQYGCSCSQKTDPSCEGVACCPVVNGARQCTVSPDTPPTCVTGPDVTQLTCTNADSCVAENPPKYCDANLTIANNCSQCGCPSGFGCDASGYCIKTVAMKGLKCKKQPYKIAFAPFQNPSRFCRHRYGREFVGDITIQRMFDIPQIRNLAVLLHFIAPLEWTALMLVPVYIKICVTESDEGCVPSDTLCLGESSLPETIERIEAMVEQYTHSNFRVSLDELDIKLSETYYCPNVDITSDISCKKIVDNGNPQDKLDILFVGDGFVSDNFFESAVAHITDYDGNNNYYGLFSEEPFKSNRDKFNVWLVNGKDMIRHTQNYGDGEGLGPNFGDVNFVSKACPISPDQTIVLSVTGYRSRAYPGENIAFNSVGGFIDSHDSRLVLHEFGHSFGKLNDEYHNNVDTIPGAVSGWAQGAAVAYYSQFGHNCRGNQQSAAEAWGDIAGTGTTPGVVGYYSSCGDDCGDECSGLIRPTENSIMKSITEKDAEGNYLKYYKVNQRYIEEEIKKAAGSVVSTLG